jgi:hypothetical protein
MPPKSVKKVVTVKSPSASIASTATERSSGEADDEVPLENVMPSRKPPKSTPGRTFGSETTGFDPDLQLAYDLLRWTDQANQSIRAIQQEQERRDAGGVGKITPLTVKSELERVEKAEKARIKAARDLILSEAPGFTPKPKPKPKPKGKPAKAKLVVPEPDFESDPEMETMPVAKLGRLGRERLDTAMDRSHWVNPETGRTPSEESMERTPESSILGEDVSSASVSVRTALSRESDEIFTETIAPKPTVSEELPRKAPPFNPSSVTVLDPDLVVEYSKNPRDLDHTTRLKYEQYKRHIAKLGMVEPESPKKPVRTEQPVVTEKGPVALDDDLFEKLEEDPRNPAHVAAVKSEQIERNRVQRTPSETVASTTTSAATATSAVTLHGVEGVSPAPSFHRATEYQPTLTAALIQQHTARLQDFRDDDVVLRHFGEATPLATETTEFAGETEETSESGSVEDPSVAINRQIANLLEGKPMRGIPQRFIIHTVSVRDYHIRPGSDIPAFVIDDIERQTKHMIIMGENVRFNVPEEEGVRVNDDFLKAAIQHNVYTIRALPDPDGHHITVYADKNIPTFEHTEELDIGRQPLTIPITETTGTELLQPVSEESIQESSSTPTKTESEPGQMDVMPSRSIVPARMAVPAAHVPPGGLRMAAPPGHMVPAIPHVPAVPPAVAAKRLSVVNPNEIREILLRTPGILPELRKQLNKKLITPIAEGGIDQAQYNQFEEVIRGVSRSKPVDGDFILKRKVEPQERDRQFIFDKY